MSRRGKGRLGCGAGTSDDRLEPALELAEKGDIHYLVFECLAERTIARENLARSRDPELGYAPSLHERMPLVPPACVARNIRIISNMGAANPGAGARAVRRHARELGLREVSCAVVVGDDIGEIVRRMPEPTQSASAVGMNSKSVTGTPCKNALCSLCGKGHRTGFG